MNHKQFLKWLEEEGLIDVIEYVKKRKFSLKTFWEKCDDGSIMMDVYLKYLPNHDDYDFAKEKYKVFDTAIKILKETTKLHNIHVSIECLFEEMISHWKEKDNFHEIELNFDEMAEELYCTYNSTLEQEALSDEDNKLYKIKRAIYGIISESQSIYCFSLSDVAKCDNSKLAADIIRENIECPKISVEEYEGTTFYYGV